METNEQTALLLESNLQSVQPVEEEQFAKAGAAWTRNTTSTTQTSLLAMELFPSLGMTTPPLDPVLKERKALQKS